MKNILTTLLFITFSIQAQFTNVMISDANSPSEPAIVINSNNTNIQFAASNINNYYVSTDAGATWSEQTLSSTLGVWGDPSLIIDNNDNFYFFHLSYPQPQYSGHWLDRIVCQKSTDNGFSFNDGSYFGLNGTKDQDKEWVSIDDANNLYVFWTEFDAYGTSNTTDKTRILFSKSTDAASTWSTPVKVNTVDGDCLDDDNTVEGAVPAIGPNGEIYTAWGSPQGLVFSKSLDGGVTWLNPEMVIDSFPGGWAFNIPGIDRCNGMPITVCDRSGGANNGTIYVNWSDQRNGTNDTDIWLKKSTDGGVTWSNLIRVNDDVAGKQQFLSWMDIDQTNGNIYIVFYDRRNYNDNNTDVYLARSTDGGNSFQNILISASPFVPTSSTFFGDYTNISAHNGVIRPVWCRLQNGQTSIWTALIDDAAIAATDDYFNVNFELSQNYPNPVDKETYISFKLKEKQKVNLTVYSFMGNKIMDVIKNTSYDFGKHTVKLSLENNNLSSGVYYYKLSIRNKTKTKKMIIN